MLHSWCLVVFAMSACRWSERAFARFGPLVSLQPETKSPWHTAQRGDPYADAFVSAAELHCRAHRPSSAWQFKYRPCRGAQVGVPATECACTVLAANATAAGCTAPS